MTITLLLFASCREAAGTRSASLQLKPGCRVRDLRATLPDHLPSLAGIAPSLSFAVNEEYVQDDHELQDGDEVALIPPVSGGSGLPIHVTANVIPPDAHEWVAAPSDGAIVRFDGIVRDHADGKATSHLEYEAYQPMAERVLKQIAAEAKDLWPVGEVAIWHRTGRLEIGETSVLITVGSPHRAEAFIACKFVIDRVKEIAPIWKKEVGPDGSFWVEGPQTPSPDHRG